MVAEVDCGNLTQRAQAARCITLCSFVYSGVFCILLCDIRIVVYIFFLLLLVCLDLCLYLVQGFLLCVLLILLYVSSTPGQWGLLCSFSSANILFFFFLLCLFLMSLGFVSCVFFLCL